MDLFAAGGLASLGGLAGGLIGALLYFAARRMSAATALDYLDALAAVFPLGWLFGRLGCSIAHDHPGLASSGLFAVAYPDLPRFDLAYLEVFFLVLFLIPLFAGVRPPPSAARSVSHGVLSALWRLPAVARYAARRSAELRGHHGGPVGL